MLQGSGGPRWCCRARRFHGDRIRLRDAPRVDEQTAGRRKTKDQLSETITDHAKDVRWAQQSHRLNCRSASVRAGPSHTSHFRPPLLSPGGECRNKTPVRHQRSLYLLGLPQGTNTEAAYGSPYDKVAEFMRAALQS